MSWDGGIHAKPLAAPRRSLLTDLTKRPDPEAEMLSFVLFCGFFLDLSFECRDIGSIFCTFCSL
jgi:hypothetical protein